MFMAYPSECRTTKGDYCDFPFKYEGKTYYECTEANSIDEPWCATETDQYGRYVQDKYGYCNGKCGNTNPSKVSDI